MTHRSAARTPIALTIAGSDSSGGAGIQADLKTFTAFGVYGASVITALTAQNTRGVQRRRGGARRPSSWRRSMRCSAISTSAPSRPACWPMPTIVAAVARRLRADRARPLVVDPVMVATSGDVLLAPDAVEAVKRELVPLATLITPNLPEAARLLGTARGAHRGRGGRPGQGAARRSAAGRCCQGRARQRRRRPSISCTTARACERFARPRIDTPPHARHRLHAVGGHRRAAGAGRAPARGGASGPRPSCGRGCRQAATSASATARARSTTCSPSARARRRPDAAPAVQRWRDRLQPVQFRCRWGHNSALMPAGERRIELTTCSLLMRTQELCGVELRPDGRST